jgi:hypothetical protein
MVGGKRLKKVAGGGVYRRRLGWNRRKSSNEVVAFFVLFSKIGPYNPYGSAYFF